MDRARGALVSLAAGFHLRGLAARWELYHVAGRWVKVTAEELGGSLALGREGLSGLPHQQKNRPEVGLEMAGAIIHHIQWQHPGMFSRSGHRRVLGVPGAYTSESSVYSPEYPA